MQTAGTSSTATKTGWLLLKLAVSVACVWYIASKLNFREAATALKSARWTFLIPAFLLYGLSKWVSAIRLQLYFRNAGIHLPALVNLKLYWLGMFYNLFLPGSISGDAYKVLMLRNRYNVPVKKISAAVLLDRFSGLLGLGILLALVSFAVALSAYLQVLIAAGAILALLLTYILVKHYFPSFSGSYIQTLLQSLLVQGLQMLAVVFILWSLDIHSFLAAYLFIFLLSSAAAVLPVTIGGLGIRELVFLQGAIWFHSSTEIAVLTSFLFYLLTVLTGVWGIIWVFRPVFPERDFKKTGTV